MSSTSSPPSAGSSSGRRESRRVPLHATVEVLTPRESTGAVINVSAGGMRVALDAAFVAGELCSIRVQTGETEAVVGQVRVVWVREQPDGCLAGLEFVTEAP